MMPTGSYVGLVQNSRANNVRFLKYTLMKRKKRKRSFLFPIFINLFHGRSCRMIAQTPDAVLHNIIFFSFFISRTFYILHHLHRSDASPTSPGSSATRTVTFSTRRRVWRKTGHCMGQFCPFCTQDLHKTYMSKKSSQKTRNYDVMYKTLRRVYREVMTNCNRTKDCISKIAEKRLRSHV